MEASPVATFKVHEYLRPKVGISIMPFSYPVLFSQKLSKGLYFEPKLYDLHSTYAIMPVNRVCTWKLLIAHVGTIFVA